MSAIEATDAQALALGRYLLRQINDVGAGETILRDTKVAGRAEADSTIEIKDAGLFRIRVSRGEE